MKKLLRNSLLGLTTLLLTAHVKAEKIPQFEQVIAHRGAANQAPENSLVSFKKAIELGATGLEFDIHLTADNEIIVFHDADMRKFKKKDQKVKDLTLSQLKKYDLGKMHNKFTKKKFKNVRIPTLKNVLAIVPKNMTVHIEMKADLKKALPKLKEVIKNSKLKPKQVCFTTKKLGVAKGLKKAFAKSIVFQNTMKPNFKKLKAGNIQGIAFPRFKDEATIKAALEQGFIVRVDNVNNKATAQKVHETGVTIADTNGQLLALIKK